jgi:hypothetical protein
MEKQQANSEQQVRGRPFKKGASGNPDGRPPKGWTWADLLREEAEKIDETDPKKARKVKHAVVNAVMEKAKKGDVQAFHEVADRMDGKAMQTTDITSQGDKIQAGVIILPSLHESSLATESGAADRGPQADGE